MTSLRFLLMLLLVGCLPALAHAQEHSSTTATTQSPAEVPSASGASQLSTQHPMILDLQFPALAFNGNQFDSSIDKGIVIPVDDSGVPEHFCLKMRSYVVARDSKDSDSVHLAHYSTCQPASRYGLKKTQEQSGASRPASMQH